MAQATDSVNTQAELWHLGLPLSAKQWAEQLLLTFCLIALAGATSAVGETSTYATHAKSNTRFIISADGAIAQDKETGLIWQRSVSADGVTWEAAFSYCKSLRLAGNERKWRLPTLKELQSLITTPKEPSMMYIDPIAFPETPPEFFWTASANDMVVAAIFFDMSKFPTGLGPDGTLGHVRCVFGNLGSAYVAPEDASYNVMSIPRDIAK